MKITIDCDFVVFDCILNIRKSFVDSFNHCVLLIDMGSLSPFNFEINFYVLKAKYFVCCCGNSV